jgi:hypothetical protein
MLYVFTCLYNHIDIILFTAYFVSVLTFPHPGLYWIYGNKDDDDDDRGIGVQALVGSRILTSPHRPHQLCGPSNVYRRLIKGDKVAGA